MIMNARKCEIELLNLRIFSTKDLPRFSKSNFEILKKNFDLPRFQKKIFEFFYKNF